MKPTSTLLLLATTATTTTATPTIPRAIPRANTIHYPHPNPHRLLHTLPAAPQQQPLSHLLSTSTSADAEADADTTLAGAVLTLPLSESNNTTKQPLLSTITSTFRIPLANIPTSGPTANNSATVYGASFWVGVDAGVSPSGTGCSPSSSLSGGVAQGGTGVAGGMLRAGVDIFYDGTLGGHQQPVIWYQGPGQKGETAFEGVVVGEGDLVRLSLVVGSVGSVGSGSAASPGEGVEKGEGEAVGGEDGEGEVVAIAENFGPDVGCPEGATPIASVRKTFPATVSSTISSTRTSSTPTPTTTPTQNTQPTLCRKEASWVLQDAPLAGLPNIPIALANFTRVAFTAGITLDDGSVRSLTVGSNPGADGKKAGLADGVEVLDIRQTQQGGRLTRCGVEEGSEGSEVVCVRVVGE
ncbi:uncharacterized protein C8A04DRAFT_25042 [Dichotomopilus funicola]|uniref:Uncharacterized protein n=1 Tax=Dichotomopilus funicola TaxID=1934379 RepID=A0AAN6V9A6_9PEZI|nr:hypothetical protein C8A04DRAFT_25042 [Dichotomopilus funicola]